ncbi:MAG: serine protease [Spirulina sp.]
MAYIQPSTLDELLRCCVVKVVVPGDWGTGFFIGEGAILTCAHVVSLLPEGSAVQFEWDGQTYDATVAKKISPAQADVALLRFPPWRDDLPCVYLGQAAQSWQKATTYGFPTDFQQGGFPAITRLSGFGKDVDGSEVLGFDWIRVKPGRSGSPLLNRDTGYVCGIIKFTQDPSGNFGGGAVPTAEILKALPEVSDLQTAFHQRCSLWRNLLPKAFAERDFQSHGQSSKQIVKCLEALNYESQYYVFKTNTSGQRRAAAFVVQAEDSRIQEWLVKR